MNRLYTIITGIEFDKDGNEIQFESNAAEVQALIEDSMILIFGGFTKSYISGGYAHDNGQTVVESVKKYEIVGNANDKEKIKTIATRLKHLYQQESILLISTPIVSSFL